MSYTDGPIQHLYPRPWKTRRHPRPAPPSSPTILPPLPALEELRIQRQEQDDIASQPTAPLAPVPAHASDDLSKHPTVPLPGRETRPERRSAIKRAIEKSRLTLESCPAPRPRLKPLKKRRRVRRRSIVLVTLLLLLTLLVGLLASGAYLIKTEVLGPLGQFFHPLAGDADGSIDGHAWNLLLLGSDNDQKFVFPDLLTQVMMVIHVDPFARSVAMVSIPRDSWVPVPGQADMHKIDQAFYLGSGPSHSFDDGVRLARATIEQDYGIHIDRYAWVGLGGFASVIDTLGGIDIDITHPLLDDEYPDDTSHGTDTANSYAVKRIYLVPGPQHLSGEQALEYVRSRHADLVGDIGRTQRQQEVLAALKKKLNASNIFDHLPALFRDLAGKVYTDLSENEMLSVANFARDLPASSIQQFTLGPGNGSQDYGTLAQVTDPGLDASQDIIEPNCATIQPTINRIFDLGDAQSCQIGTPGQ